MKLREATARGFRDRKQFAYLSDALVDGVPSLLRRTLRRSVETNDTIYSIDISSTVDRGAAGDLSKAENDR